MKWIITLIIIIGISYIVTLIGLPFMQDNDSLDYSLDMTQQEQELIDAELKHRVATSDIDIPFHIIEKHRSNDEMEDINWIIEQLKTEFAETIHELPFQISLKDLKRDLIKTHGESKGREMFEYILRSAFPELADEILANVRLIDQYDEWLAENLLALGEMDANERQLEVWKKRREIFGDAAEQIWSELQPSKEDRQVAVNTTMEVLDKSENMPLATKAKLLLQSYENNYLGTIEDIAFDARGVLSQAFFSLESVQQELHDLDEKDRLQKMAEVRKELGFSDENIAVLAALDKKNNEQWDNGYAYMTEREKLLANTTEGDRETELHKLREKYFSNNANTIKLEEEDLGLFRFDRPRIYGRN